MRVENDNGALLTNVEAATSARRDWTRLSGLQPLIETYEGQLDRRAKNDIKSY